MTSSLMPTDTTLEHYQDGTAYLQARKTRCRLCKQETREGHPITVCVFALMKRVEYLEGRMAKVKP